jgi:hypothetical protein
MAPDGTNSTIIQGNPNVRLCNAQRLLLQFYVYAPPVSGAPGAPPPSNTLPPKFASQVLEEIQEHWECTAEIDDASGLRGQCWEAKNRKKNPHSCCDPTLIFRGSRPVYTDLAIYVRIDILGMMGFYGDLCLLPSLDDVDPGQPPQTVYTLDGPVTIPGDQTKNFQWGVSALGGADRRRHRARPRAAGGLEQIHHHR